MLARALILAVVGMAVVVPLSGCAPKYRCNNFPLGSCRNMSQIYDDTGSGFKDYREQGSSEEDSKKAKGKKKESQVVIGNTVKGINELQPGDPVLTKPEVLRVWVKPWEDKEKDLNYSFIYIRTKESTWTVLE